MSGVLKGDSQLAKNSFAMKMLAFVEGESCNGAGGCNIGSPKGLL